MLDPLDEAAPHMYAALRTMKAHIDAALVKDPPPDQMRAILGRLSGMAAPALDRAVPTS